MPLALTARPAPARPRAPGRTALVALLALLVAGGTCAQALAQPAPAAASAPVFAAVPPIPHASVAEALRVLRAQDGNGTVVTESDGWVIINEPLAAAQWSFAPKDHAAYPSVVRRVIQRGPESAVNVDTAMLCEAPAAACTALRQEFDALNDRIVQAVKARGRGGSSRPAATPQ